MSGSRQFPYSLPHPDVGGLIARGEGKSSPMAHAVLGFHAEVAKEGTNCEVNIK